MRRPAAVTVLAVQDRRARKVRRPWVVRWKVDGQEHSRSFETKAAAEDLRARLLVAARDGQRFDRATGDPTAWSGSTDTFAAFCADWAARQWPTWAPRSRRSAVEALVRAIPLAVPAKAPAAPSGLRAYLTDLVTPSVTADDARCEAWLRRWSLPLADLDAEAAAAVHAGLGLRADGIAASPTTAARYRTTTHAVLLNAVAIGKLAADPWPTARRARRRVEKRSTQVDIELLPSKEQALAIIDAIASHQPASHNYKLLSQVCWYLGTRPSEALVLRAEDFVLPAEGWGSVRISRSEDGEGGEGPTKTGVVRTVPVPPALVAIVRAWLDGRTEGPLVRTRTGGVPSLGNWGRALERACDAVGVVRISPYDFRHCCATMMLAAGVAPGEAARRLGHSVEVLLGTYAGVMGGDEDTANARIAAALSV